MDCFYFLSLFLDADRLPAYLEKRNFHDPDISFRTKPITKLGLDRNYS